MTAIELQRKNLKDVPAGTQQFDERYRFSVRNLHAYPDASCPPHLLDQLYPINNKQYIAHNGLHSLSQLCQFCGS
jgi:hypothetical protein